MFGRSSVSSDNVLHKNSTRQHIKKIKVKSNDKKRLTKDLHKYLESKKH